MKILPAALALLWVAAVGAGVLAITRYASRPGIFGNAPEAWPSSSRIPAPAGTGKLLLFAHPRCPCTQATLDNLDRMLPVLHEKVDVVVLVAGIEGGETAETTPVGARARRLPGVGLIDDQGAEETRRFGVETSGHALFYDANAVLRFSGGLTSARGHAGAADSLRAIVHLATGDAAPSVRAPVFGCALRSGGI